MLQVFYLVVVVVIMVMVVLRQGVDILSTARNTNTSLVELFATIAAIPPTIESDKTCHPEPLTR